MNLKESNFKIKLYNILSDLERIEAPATIMQRCVNEKLDASYKQYQSSMRNIYNYILSRSNVKVVKALSKINKSKEKADGNDSK